MQTSLNMRTRRIVAAGLLIAAIPLIWVFWTRRFQLPDDKQIEQSLVVAKDGIESRSLRRVLSIISEDYKDAEDNDRRELTRLAAGAFQSARAITIHLSDLDIQVNGDQARSTCEVTVTFVDASAETQTEASHVEMAWRKEKRRWKVVSITGLVYPNSVF